MENNTEKEPAEQVKIIFKDSGYVTRSIAPEENRIHDINLLVFCGESAEDRIWTRTTYDSSEHFITLNLLKGKRYSFYAFINFGKKIDAEEISDLNNLKVEIESAERFDKGIPMTAAAEDILIGEDSQGVDNDYGWVSLDHAYIDSVRGGFIIEFPKARYLK